MEKKISKSFTITGSSNIIKRVEMLLGLLHFNSAHGHSGIFGMSFDGDGPDSITIDPKPNNRKQVQKLAGVGYDVEIISGNVGTGYHIDRDRKSNYSYDKKGKKIK